jgi:hypothetical protein
MSFFRVARQVIAYQPVEPEAECKAKADVYLLDVKVTFLDNSIEILSAAAERSIASRFSTSETLRCRETG